MTATLLGIKRYLLHKLVGAWNECSTSCNEFYRQHNLRNIVDHALRITEYDLPTFFMHYLVDPSKRGWKGAHRENDAYTLKGKITESFWLNSFTQGYKHISYAIYKSYFKGRTQFDSMRRERIKKVEHLAMINAWFGTRVCWLFLRIPSTTQQ